MPRSAGITVSGVVVIIGSMFTILCGAMILLASSFVSKSSPSANLPLNLGGLLIFEAALLFGFGGWGSAAGIGLLYLKRWARISLLVFAGFLVCASAPVAVMMAVIPLPDIHDANLPANFTTLMRIGMGLFYSVFAALGGFWLYFFNKRSVKAQFQTKQPVPESAAGDSFLGAAVPSPIAVQIARPLSITIIGWFLLVGSAIAPLGLFMNRALFPGVQVPFYFLGFFLFGWNAYLVLIAWMVAQMTAAVGLLKLRRWGWFAAIAMQCLGALNCVLLVVLPGHRARFQQIMETMTASMNARMPQPAPFVFPVWIGFAMGFSMVLVILWFLVSRRKAFASTREDLHPGVS